MVKWRSKKAGDVVFADTKAKCRDVVEMIKDAPVVGVDVESYGCDPKKHHPIHFARCLSVQFSVGWVGKTRMPDVFVPMWAGSVLRDESDLTANLGLLDVFGEWFESDTPQKVGHNFKFDMHVLLNDGYRVNGLLGDTLVMDYYAYNAQRLHGLKEAIRRCFRKDSSGIAPYTADDAVDFRDVFRAPKPLKRKGKNGETLYGKAMYVPSLAEVIQTKAGVAKLVDYGPKDPFFTVALYHHLRERLKSRPWREGKSYFDFYEEIALPYTSVLFDMERHGCPVDEKQLSDIAARLDKDIADDEREFLRSCVKKGVAPSELTGFSFESGQKIAHLLFTRLGFSRDKSKDTPTGLPGTSASALEAAAKSKKAKSLIEILLRRKRRATLRKMFVRKLVTWVPKYYGRAHSTFKQTGTRTNRLASAAHNLENIPSGKKDDEYKLRSAFVAPSKKYVVADIDLSQIEVRITAHVTREKKLIDLITHGHDQHLLTMTSLFPDVNDVVGKKPCTSETAALVEKEIGKTEYADMRRKAKVLNFGVIYGMGPNGFAAQVGCSLNEARSGLQKFFEGYPQLAAGIKRVQRKCYQKGYVRTLAGRYCDLPDIRSMDRAVQGAAMRQAFNYVIQGSAADIIMMGMILCWKDVRLRKMGVKLINQIHDELVFLIPRRHYEKAKPIIEDYVSHPYRYFGMPDLVVDTPADLGAGDNWSDAKK